MRGVGIQHACRTVLQPGSHAALVRYCPREDTAPASSSATGEVIWGRTPLALQELHSALAKPIGGANARAARSTAYSQRHTYITAAVRRRLQPPGSLSLLLALADDAPSHFRQSVVHYAVCNPVDDALCNGQQQPHILWRNYCSTNNSVQTCRHQWFSQLLVLGIVTPMTQI